MSVPLALTTSFQDMTNASSRRSFKMIGNADGTTVIAFQSAPTIGSSTGVRIKSPIPPSVIDSPLGVVQDLFFTGLKGSSGVIDEPSGYLKYELVSGSAPASVWVEFAPQPSVGPAGSASIAGGLGPFATIAVANQATLSGLVQTIDGVALSTAGMRVYLANQTTTTQNGAWLVQSGNWIRPSDWASGSAIPRGTQILVSPGGTTNFTSFGSTWYVDSIGTGGVVDTDTIVAYPLVCKGQQALTSASPSTATVSSLWVKSTTTSVVTLVEVTNQANNTLKGVLTAGAGTGSLAITGANTNTDTIAWTITNA